MRRFFLFLVVLAIACTVAVASAGPVTPDPNPNPSPTPPFIVGHTHFFIVDDGVNIVPSPIAVDKTEAEPTSTPSPAVSMIGALTASAASGIIANDLTKRGLFAHTDYATFWHECVSTLKAASPDLTRSVQFHWIVPDPQNVLSQNSFLGLSRTSLSIAWSVYDCNGTPIVSGTDPVWESRLYQKYSWRIPLSQIMGLVQLTNVLHTNTIHAPLIAGFSSGAGAINSYLDQANPQTQIVENTFLSGADRLAADFCGMQYPNASKGLGCWRVKR